MHTHGLFARSLYQWKCLPEKCVSVFTAKGRTYFLTLCFKPYNCTHVQTWWFILGMFDALWFSIITVIILCLGLFSGIIAVLWEKIILGSLLKFVLLSVSGTWNCKYLSDCFSEGVHLSANEFGSEWLLAGIWQLGWLARCHLHNTPNM